MDFPLCVDSSMRAAFVSCPQKFFREYMQNLRRPGGSVHLVAGGAFAKGIEVARREIWGKGTPLNLALARAVKEAAIAYGDFEVGDDEPLNIRNKRWERVALAILDYFREYPPDTDPIQPYMTVQDQPAVEFSFALPTDVTHPQTGDPIFYSGHFDMLGQFRKGLWVVDEKTTSKLGASWINSWDLRAQFTGYVWGAKQFDLPVVGCITRGVSFLKDSFGHAQVITYRPQWQIDRWYEQLCRDILRMIQCWEDDYWDYNLADACTAYGGCPFNILCSRANPEDWIKERFVEEEWDPVRGEVA